MDKKIKHKYDTLSLHLNLTRAFAGFSLLLYWLNISGEGSGMVLVLGILIFSILRHYFSESTEVIFMEGLFVGGISYIWPEFAFAYCIPIFEGNLNKKFIWILPGLILGILQWNLNLTLIFYFLLGAYLGYLFRIAKEERDYYKEESDKERRKRYEAESLNTELLSLREEALQMTELAERNRIAQQLHDDVGHELTGAVLGLQAFSSMIEEHNLEPYEKEILSKVNDRVNNSAKVLRETVHNMKPYTPLGIDALRQMVEDIDLPITFKVYGNPESIPVHYWVLLKTALKEGLTNIIRHADAKEVTVQLDITPTIIRFSLENDGIILENDKSTSSDKEKTGFNEGMGLRSLRQRTKAYGGSFSAVKLSEKDLFRLIIVFPLLKGD